MRGKFKFKLYFIETGLVRTNFPEGHQRWEVTLNLSEVTIRIELAAILNLDLDYRSRPCLITEQIERLP